MGFIITVSYIFTILVVYTILRFIKTDEDWGLHMMCSVFWPAVVVVIIILTPFYLIDKVTKKYKRNECQT